MSTCLHQFFGPVRVYVRKEAGEYAVCVDPFPVIGTGNSMAEALREASHLIAIYFAEFARLAESGEKVLLVNPIAKTWRRGNETVLIGALYAFLKRKPPVLPLQSETRLPLARIQEYVQKGLVNRVEIADLAPAGR